jgi:hypothetical protein
VLDKVLEKAVPVRETIFLKERIFEIGTQVCRKSPELQMFRLFPCDEMYSRGAMKELVDKFTFSDPPPAIEHDEFCAVVLVPLKKVREFPAPVKEDTHK